MKTDLAQSLLLAPGCKLTYLYTLASCPNLEEKTVDLNVSVLRCYGLSLESRVAWAVWGGDCYIRQCSTALESPERGSRLIC